MLMEIDFCIKDLDYALDNLEDWMAPRHKPKGLANIGHKACPYTHTTIVSSYNSVADTAFALCVWVGPASQLLYMFIAESVEI